MTLTSHHKEGVIFDIKKSVDGKVDIINLKKSVSLIVYQGDSF